MIIDTSALVAIVFQEPDFEDHSSHRSARSRAMSAASLLETSIVIFRAKGEEGIRVLEEFVAASGIDVVDLDAEHARLAFDAYQRYGKGMGHPAQLNILDCCTYALAASRRDAILFRGSDFAKTDIALAI